MNDNARKWVEALRSGKFTQARRKLRDGDGYCCLGVACELFRRETGTGEWDDTPGTWRFITPDDGWAQKYDLPPAVRGWLGLSEATGLTNEQLVPPPTGGQRGIESLAGVNDYGWTLEQIADVIEREPDGLFVNDDRRNT